MGVELWGLFCIFAYHNYCRFLFYLIHNEKGTTTSRGGGAPHLILPHTDVGLLGNLCLCAL